MQLSTQHLAEVVECLRKTASVGDPEKRRAARVEVRTKVRVGWIRDGLMVGDATAILQDISSLGVGLMQSRLLKKGDQFLLHLPLRHDKELPVMCVVAHCRELATGVYGTGAMFAKVLDEHQAGELARMKMDEVQRIQSQMLE